ncbi:MAG: response regulator transcription factor [Saprospiraceae bacterium]
MIKVLYVEDETNLAKIVSDTLSHRQMKVQLIQRGDQAFQAFQSFQPDICILDVMLPHVDGYTISKQIRSVDPQVPIIFLTAKSLSEDVLDGFQAGGNDFMRKPFSMEELIARIKNLLSITGKASMLESTSEGVTIGKFIFHSGRQELIFNGNTKRLSHRETELLSMFVDHKSETVLRKNILDKIWGNDSIFNSRNLDVYITKIREYLKADATIEIITLKGVGYRLID